MNVITIEYRYSDCTQAYNRDTEYTHTPKAPM